MTDETAKKIRLWPGVVIVILQWLAAYGIGMVVPGTMLHGFGMMGGPAIGLLLLFIWWAFLSRASLTEKLFGVSWTIAMLVGATMLADRSIKPEGLFIYGVPIVCLVFVATVAMTRAWPEPRRRLALALTVLVAAGAFTLVRSKGVDGYFQVDFAWRWQKTAEEKLLEQQADLAALAPPSDVPGLGEAADEEAADEETATEETAADEAAGEETAADGAESEASAAGGDETPASSEAPEEPSEGEAATGASLNETATDESTSPWPGFRGPQRDSVIHGLEIATDWQSSPPEEIWRRPIGPGWGSFVISEGLLYTQEQRGEEEIVAAYDAESGEPVWMHRDPARFWEALAGAGPRATPQLGGERLYSLGATGILNVLDAATGAKIWSRDVAADSGAAIPQWGFSSSPLLVDDLVVVYSGAGDGKAVVAYDADSGEPRWFAPSGLQGYSSVHLATLHGVRQLLVLTDEGVTSHAPSDGEVLWKHDWKAAGARCVQPAFAADGDPLIGTGFGVGVRRLDLARDGETWQVSEAWTSNALKPYFNDFVVHEGHAYGFDGRILASMDVENGERAWKGGRYGHGQLVLLADQDLLLVLSEKGELALVAAEPDGHRELARMPAIEGKTWNHPMIAGDVLYVRNGEEMAAFRLPVSSRVASMR